MAPNPVLKKMLDAGMQFTEMSQKQAEKIVKEFVKSGQARKKDSEELVRQMVDRGRGLSEQVVAAVQAELAKQMNKFAGRLDEVESRVEALAAKVGLAAKATADKVAEKATPKMAPATPAASTGPSMAGPSTTPSSTAQADPPQSE